MEKWGFDSIQYGSLRSDDLDMINSLAEKGIDCNREFRVLYYGAGCGNAVSRLKYLYPRADIIGIEENEKALEVKINGIPIYGKEYKDKLDESEFDIVIHTKEIFKADEREK